MIQHYIKNYLRNLKKNSLHISINIIGFSTGILILSILFLHIRYELNYDKFNTKYKNIYRITAGGYGVTPPCLKEKLTNKIPEIRNIVRFTVSDKQITSDKKDPLCKLKAYYTDSSVMKSFSFIPVKGTKHCALADPNSIVLTKSAAIKLFGNINCLGKSVTTVEGDIFRITSIIDNIPKNSHLRFDALISNSSKTIEELSNCSTWSILTYIEVNENTDIYLLEKKINECTEDIKMKTESGTIQLNLQRVDKIYFSPENNKFDGSIHGNLSTTRTLLSIALTILILVITNHLRLTAALIKRNQRELAIRKLNGAEGKNIVYQSLNDNIITSILAGGVTLLMSELFLAEICNILKVSVPDSRLNVVFSVIFFSLLTGIITGLTSGYISIRTKALHIFRNNNISTKRSWRNVSTIFQILIMSIVLNYSFLLSEQINFMLNKDIGFKYKNVVYVEFKNDSVISHKVIRNKLIEMADISMVSFTSTLPGEECGKSFMKSGNKTKLCSFMSADRFFFDLYNIEVLSDKNYRVKYSGNSDCIINHEAFKQFELEKSPDNTISKYKIISDCKNFNFNKLNQPIVPLIIKYSETGRFMSIRLNNNISTEIISQIEKVILNYAEKRDYKIVKMKDKLKSLYKKETDFLKSINAYSVISVIITLLGLWGTTMLSVKDKCREMSIRRIMGASNLQNKTLLVYSNVKPAIMASIMAIAPSLYFYYNWISDFCYKSPLNYGVFILTILTTQLLVILTTLTASFKISETK